MKILLLAGVASFALFVATATVTTAGANSVADYHAQSAAVKAEVQIADE